MKTLTILVMRGCPYCRMAKKAVEELQSEDASLAQVPVRWIDENREREAALPYQDYWYVPSLYIDGEKLYEAHPGDSYETILEQVRLGLARAAQDTI